MTTLVIEAIWGLDQTAKHLDKFGEPMVNLSKKMLSLLTSGAAK